MSDSRNRQFFLRSQPKWGFFYSLCARRAFHFLLQGPRLEVSLVWQGDVTAAELRWGQPATPVSPSQRGHLRCLSCLQQNLLKFSLPVVLINSSSRVHHKNGTALRKRYLKEQP